MKNWSFGVNMNDLGNWPHDENGEPVAPAFLEHLPSLQMEAEVDMNLLQAYGIPVIPQYPNDGSFGRIIIGIPGGGVDLFVPETLLEDARNILSGDIIEDEEQREDLI